MRGGADPTSRRPGLAGPSALAGAAAVTLAVSYALPTVTFRTIRSKVPEVYSIWGGIVSLWEDGNTVLAPVVFLFSIVFPVAKLALLAWLLVRLRRRPGALTGARAVLGWLRLLGKWSMLDVLIVGLFVGSIRIGLATASSLGGILVFAAAIVLSMLASHALEGALAGAQRRGGDVAAGPVPPRRGPAARWCDRALAAAAMAAVLAVAWRPIFVVTKGVFFSNEVALWGTSRAMVREGERVLGAGLLVVVLVLPLLRASASVVSSWSRGVPRRGARLGALLDEWAMLDVFALALLIVHVKLAELATVRITGGFWAVLVAAVLVTLDGWRQRPLGRGPAAS